GIVTDNYGGFMSRYVASLLFCACLMPAQELTGSVMGSVSGPTGSSVMEVTAKFISVPTGGTPAESSAAPGSFAFNRVPPGCSTVSVEQTGFKQYQRKQIEMTPGNHMGLGTLALEVGVVSESVTVKAEGAVLQTASSERAGVVTSQEISGLTVINRDFTTFAELQPGVVINQGGQVQSFTGNNT